MRKPNIAIRYLDFPPKEKTIRINKYYEHLFYNTVFYTLLAKHFTIKYVNKNPDFILQTHHYSTVVNNKAVNICFMGEDFIPDFDLFDYGIAFDSLQFQDRYQRYPLWIFSHKHIDIEASKVLDFPALSLAQAKELLGSKFRFCSFVVSNDTLAQSVRADFFTQLSAYKQVSSGGLVYNNVGGRVKDKLAFQGECKFSICFENYSHKGYVTEKLIDGFDARTVPIYWGCPSIAEEFNPESFINCHDYKSFDEVIEKIKEIDNDDALWCKMIAASEKVRCDKATVLLQNFEKFMINIFSQSPKDAKRIANIHPHSQQAYDLWNIRSKCRVSIADLEKLYSLYNKIIPRKKRNDASTNT